MGPLAVAIMSEWPSIRPNNGEQRLQQIGLYLAPSPDDWMTCSPRHLTLISLTMNPQGGSYYQNLRRTMERAICLIILCTIGNS